MHIFVDSWDLKSFVQGPHQVILLLSHIFNKKCVPLFKDSPKESVGNFLFINYTIAPLPLKKVIMAQNTYFSGVESQGILQSSFTMGSVTNSSHLPQIIYFLPMQVMPVGVQEFFTFKQKAEALYIKPKLSQNIAFIYFFSFYFVYFYFFLLVGG